MQPQGTQIFLGSNFTPVLPSILGDSNTSIVMSGHDHIFSTEHIHPSDKPSTQNSTRIATSYPPTHYPIGLTQIAVGREYNPRLTSYIDKVKFVESSGAFEATVHLDAWGDTILNSAACTWLPIPKPDREFQYGRQSIKSDEMVHKITFDQEFTSAPKVVVWFKTVDLDGGLNWHVALDVSAATTKGFTLKCVTWGGTKLYWAEASWIAYPASRPTIDSGYFNTYEIRPYADIRHQHAKTVKFSKTFVRAPKVYFALSNIDSKNSSDLRLKAYVTDVTPQEMTLHLDSWEGPNMFSSGGQWIAIQDL